MYSSFVLPKINAEIFIFEAIWWHDLKQIEDLIDQCLFPNVNTILKAINLYKTSYFCTLYERQNSKPIILEEETKREEESKDLPVQSPSDRSVCLSYRLVNKVELKRFLAYFMLFVIKVTY